MRTSAATVALLMSFGVDSLSAGNSLGSEVPTAMEVNGAPTSGNSLGANIKAQSDELRAISTELPTAELSRIAAQPFSEASNQTRSAKDAQIYRAISPSV